MNESENMYRDMAKFSMASYSFIASLITAKITP